MGIRAPTGNFPGWGGRLLWKVVRSKRFIPILAALVSVLLGAACDDDNPAPTVPPAATDPSAPTTTANPAGGTYTSAQSVALSCSDGTAGSGCAVTHYTTDGSAPTTASTVYSAAISVAATTTLKFFSVDNAGNGETVKTETYVTECTIAWTASKETGVNETGGGYKVHYKATAGVTKTDPFVDVPNPGGTSLVINDAGTSAYKCANYYAVEAYSTDNPTGSALSAEVGPL